MKKRRLLFSALVLSLAHTSYAQITNPAPYCVAAYDDGVMNVPHFIETVSLGTLSNNSGTTQYPGQHYVYYNNLTAPNLVKGNTYPLYVKYDGGVTTHFVAVYIDFNKNNSFNDAGERVLNAQFPANSSTNPLTANVVIPATAQTGTTRMRVVCFEDDMYTMGTATPPTVATPCTTDNTGLLDWGETEDYNVNITGSATGVSDVFGGAAFTIYPNPAKDKLYIGTELAGCNMRISDMQGRVVASYNEIAVPAIDISQLQPGIYLVNVIKGNISSTQKLAIAE